MNDDDDDVITDETEENGKKDIKKKLVNNLLEAKRMEAYAEHRTDEMKYCNVCERITYKKVPGKKIGKKWVCIDCLKRLKEIIETMDQWEEELAMESQMKDQIDGNLGI
ncbi:MAG: hypothetical protein R6U17_05500 [Thermoplasmata archaeon]